MALDSQDPQGQDSSRGRERVEAAPVVTPLVPRKEDALVPEERGLPVRRGRRRVLLGVAALAVLAGAGYWGHGWWTEGRFMVKTDDAYLQADIAAISPKVQGYIAEIAVQENQRVAAGDVIARLDDGDDRIALATAESRIASQRATLARIEAQTLAAQAAVGQAQAQKQAADALMRNSERTATRLTTLVAAKSTAQATLDDATSALDQARASAVGAEAQIASAEANVAVLRAEYAEAASQMQALSLAVDQGRRTLDLNVLRAPYAGILANLAIEQGDLVSPGQRIAAVVPTDHVYIEANFKETQLGDIAPGALVHVTVDALPGQSFEGRVQSVAPATGAMFSVLPATNATGNFTKVVQRVPVRISLPPEALATGQLRAGLSVVVEVDSRTSGGA